MVLKKSVWYKDSCYNVLVVCSVHGTLEPVGSVKALRETVFTVSQEICILREMRGETETGRLTGTNMPGKVLLKTSITESWIKI